MNDEGILLYVGGDAQNAQRRRLNLTGRRCFSGAYGPKSRFTAEEAGQVTGILDSGAFSDSPEDRLDASGSLQRQIEWEKNAERFWGYPWRAEAVVSYDMLIDEKWTGMNRRKERWSVADAEKAVEVTVGAAAYLSSKRELLKPRRLILACQGVDAQQYRECVQGVLEYATSDDWIGLGGWCVLGWFRRWIPEFWASMRLCLPEIADAGIHRVHIFGVMYRPVLGGLLWLCDQHDLTLSTDSSGPVLQPLWKDRVKAGCYAATWEENTAICRERLRTIRSSPDYREPPMIEASRQLVMF